MLDVYTVSFFGHREIPDALTVERQLERFLRDLLIAKTYVEFLVGRNGEFDQLAASTVHRLKRKVRSDNSSLVLVLPYVMAQITKDQASFESFYDSIEISEAAAGKHFKSAIQARNRKMIDRSDLIICYVEHTGGAYQSIRYAEKQGKQIYNLAGNR